ncbi:mannan endo-1,4-beta-mannosidase A [Ceratobasidium theobromae]|uniref:mannan endo-1,4-beta-mannosidase n=1 Tax=Ceratobasidium theobromae TaxID=1582974 RepID=A0A5N5QG70_9AGAM|nr:mannan endo-1,4-beta-mannosidase A [Ceratobasidium theobromae]
MKYAFTAATGIAILGLAAARTVPRQSTSFVKTSGQEFTLDGQRFTVVGSNAYWMAQLSTTADMTTAFNDLKNAGFTTLRTWGFNEVTSPSGTYYNLWSGSTPTLNTGSNGLGKFDTVVAQAKAAGIRLIVALTNNWSDYGGMDVYVKQLLGSNNHDLFYTDATVKAAFKNYVKGFVERYKNEPTIMAWELANEPRCKGSTGTSTGTCTTQTITTWATELSAYIKSIDSNHLVALGDEGFYNQPSAATYPYQGSEGVDFDANLSAWWRYKGTQILNIATEISSLDFGTFHSYPQSWGQSDNVLNWGTQWIKDHATSQKAANKPVIIEEFGTTTDQATVYTAWWDAIVSSGLTGDLIWQAGSTVSTGKTSDDGYAVYPGEAEYTLQTKYAAALKARA